MWTIARTTRRRYGLIVGERAVELVPPGAQAESAPPGRLFAFPEGLGWEQPAELGRAFGEWLEAQRVPGRSVVLALPARWLALRTTDLPPLDDRSMLGGMLELAADELFAERLEELAWTWQSAGREGGLAVSLVACRRDRIERVQQFAQSAGLRLDAARPLAMAAADALALPAGQTVLVLSGPAGGEVALVEDGRVIRLGPLQWAPGQAESTDAELSRALLALSPGPQWTLVVLGGPALAEAASAAADREAQPPALRGAPAQGALSVARVLAATVCRRTEGPDFLPHRPPMLARLGRPRTRRLALAALAGVAMIVWALLGWSSLQGRGRDAKDQLDAMAPLAGDLRQRQAMLEATAPWFADRPAALQALRELTRQFPESGSIWLTQYDWTDDGRVSLAGQARSRSEVLELLGRLEASGSFDQITSHYVRQQAGSDGRVAFAVSGQYTPEARP